MKRKPLSNDEGEVRELTRKDFARAKPASEAFPELIAMQKKARGRPKADTTKQSTTLRLDPEVIEFFKRNGRGWQTRLNDALKEYVLAHK